MPKLALPAWIIARPIAHRGLFDARAGVPENSLAAVRAAMEAGYPVELDLQAAKDGVAVFHDRMLKRMTGRSGRVVDFPIAELKRLALAGSSETIPSLEDVLALVAGRIPLVLEIKNEGRAGAFERMVFDRIANYRGDLAIVSFNPFSLGWFARHAAKIPRGQTSARFDGSKLPAWRRVLQRKFWLNVVSRPHFLLYELGALPNRAVAKRRKRGMKVIAYTVRSAADAVKARGVADNFIFETIRP